MCEDLNLNLPKTKCLHFAQISYLKINLEIDNVLIEQVKKLKFLRRTISESQSVKHHYENAFKNCSNNLNLLKSLTSIKGGLKPQYGLHFYKSFVQTAHSLPILEDA